MWSTTWTVKTYSLSILLNILCYVIKAHESNPPCWTLMHLFIFLNGYVFMNKIALLANLKQAFHQIKQDIIWISFYTKYYSYALAVLGIIYIVIFCQQRGLMRCLNTQNRLLGFGQTPCIFFTFFDKLCYWLKHKLFEEKHSIACIGHDMKWHPLTMSNIKQISLQNYISTVFLKNCPFRMLHTFKANWVDYKPSSRSVNIFKSCADKKAYRQPVKTFAITDNQRYC